MTRPHGLLEDRRGAPRIRVLLLLVLLAVPGASHAQDEERDWPHLGAGWSMTRLDADIVIEPDEQRVRVEGTIDLRLDGLDHSYGPTLKLNWSPASVMSFVSAAAGDAAVQLNVPQPGAEFIKQAVLRFDEPARRGAALTVRFEIESTGHTEQFFVTGSLAMASCWSGWLPFTNPATTPLALGASVAAVPGRTTLRLPARWVGLVDGELLERRREAEVTVEIWETPPGIARSLVAGPYDIGEHLVDGRRIRVYLLPGEKPMSAESLARTISDALAAQEEHYGPFPFPSYGVAEVPLEVPGQTWSAASLQTFLVARTPHFLHEHGNLPLWAHEVGHGWWGNAVGVTGPAAKWCGESLAQFGALLALESLEGAASMREFLGFSRSGYSPLQCAAGYFALIDQGGDLPLATMGPSRWSHDLANSKGHWVYHMLRRRMGDEAFFGVLRSVIADFKGKAVSGDALRERFLAAAPGPGLDVFLAQWLDRTGAPILDVDWHATAGHDGIVLTLEQAQPGEPFVLDLDVAIDLVEGETHVEPVVMDARSQVFRIATPARPVGVRLDPEYDLLLWRPEYGPRPGQGGRTARPIPVGVRDAIVGRYHVEAVDLHIDVRARAGAVYIQTTGGPELRLQYDGDLSFSLEVGEESATVVFDAATSPSASVTLQQAGQVFVGVRED